MDLIDEFGKKLKKDLDRNPETARKELVFGYKAFALKNRIAPDRRLPESKRYVGDRVMDVIIKALAKPEETCMCSLFVPGELMNCVGVTPFSVEALSCYIAGTHIEKIFLDATEEQGIPDTMCSFHRVFLGAAESELMPKPPFLIYTNVACDANLMTFPYLKEKYKIPGFYIDVPWEKNEDAVHYVADQLRELGVFLSDMTNKPVTDELLMQSLRRSNKATDTYERYLDLMNSKSLPGMMTTEMYGIFMSRIFSGSNEAVKYTDLLLSDIQKAGDSDPIKIAWVHMMPFMQPSLRDYFNFSDNIRFTTDDLVYDGFRRVDESKPYEAMAEKLVHSVFNGRTEERADFAVKMARKTNSDGVVIFSHWGCKATIGSAGLIKDALESEGIPALVLDGDGCSPANSPDGQLKTRTEAFIEMLETARQGK